MRTFLFFFLSLVFFTDTIAQTQDLIALAQGDFLGMNALFDEQGNLFGYISIYDYGKSGELTKKFEYVILDKNLNPVANKTFDGDITAGSYSGFINFEGKIILRPTSVDMRFIKEKDVFTPSAMVIDPKDNTITKKIFYDYDHGTFKEVLQQESWTQSRKEYKTEKKQNGFNYVSYVAEIKEGGFLVLEYDDYGYYENNNRIIRYNENKDELWRYEYNEKGNQFESQVLRAIERDSNYYYGLLKEKKRKPNSRFYKAEITFYLIVIDMKTGQVIHKKAITGPENILSRITTFSTVGFGQLDNNKTFDDKIVLVGRSYQGLGFYDGIARLVIDRKTFDVDLKTLSYEDDFKKFIPKINKYGFVEKKYFLDPRDIFIMKDGSVGMLFEKYKSASEYSAQKTTDLVYVYTDKDFKIADAKIFEKEKSKWQNSDYLFSQYLNNGNDVVFFYRDFQRDDDTKDRNWNLFINTLIGGTFKQEMIPISSQEHFLIFPYIAKEGYILLQEFNKNAKYNRIRLERLNY